MLKKFFILFTFLVVIIIGGGVYAYQQLEALAHRKITANPEQLLVIERGTSSQKLAKLLEEQGITQNTKLLPYLIRLHPELSHFKAGVYSLDGIETVEGLLQHLNDGKEVQLNVQFIEGKDFKNWREQLAKAKYLNQTLAGKSEEEIAKLLGIPYQKLEGWFAPDTYSYVPHTDDIDILKRAYKKQQQNLDEAWQNRAESLPLTTPYEMLILASIVEKETGIASERPQVASVFINRLRAKWKLQTDPTVIYGMGNRYNGNIHKKDLLEATPYNTYVIDGLPPTPIAMPSKAAIQAVSQPDTTPYFYFVADGTGGHKFSKTNAEHERAVRNWIQIERQRRTEKK
ncbi:endolytic transglycosylase MltG [Otariodibacter sp.]|uniref:endolytic transglycosylase MltG n=1 Tax=Otariodibacter sp. TaxID=3030919 RepID=UPI0026144D01|nr:endolytic transglycosylase MltG [Otariodibacter sp.]